MKSFKEFCDAYALQPNVLADKKLVAIAKAAWHAALNVDFDEIEEKETEWLKRINEIEIRENRDFLSSYAEGYIDGLSCVADYLKERKAFN